MGNSRVVIIGAGIAGLSAAVDLAARGLDVTLLERNRAPGGKMRALPVDGSRIDSGPTVLTMRWVFDDLFARAGARLEDHLGLQPAGLLARHDWGNGERLDLFADRERSSDAIGRLAGAAEARRYRTFCDHAGRVFAALNDTFMRDHRPRPPALLARAPPRQWPDLLRMRPFGRLAPLLDDHFRDPRLRQLFGRYATYCGSSPFRAPATLALIAHVEGAGVDLVTGGMTRLAQALTERARAAGGDLRFATAARAIEADGRRVRAVHLSDGARVAADAVIANTDVAGLAAGNLGDAAAAAVAPFATGERSLSAMTWALLTRTTGFPLAHHNVFFGRDYAAEFADLFTHRRLPREPTVYVCAQDRADDGARTGEGPERLFCIVNAPATGDVDPFGAEAVAEGETRLRATLARSGLYCDVDAAPRRVTTPADFEGLFPGTGGALYGRAVHGWRAPFRRPGARSRLRGFYLAGGSVHPGPGVPMVAISGCLAADAVARDLRSKGR